MPMVVAGLIDRVGGRMVAFVVVHVASIDRAAPRSGQCCIFGSFARSCPTAFGSKSGPQRFKIVPSAPMR